MLTMDKAFFPKETVPVTPGSAPVLSRFVVDKESRSRYPTVFYDLVKSSEQAWNTVKKAQVQGDTAASDRAASSFEASVYPILSKASAQIGSLTRQINTIRFNESLAPEEKAAYQDEIIRAQHEIEKQTILAVQEIKRSWKK
jgi:hypothetical protein